MRRSRSFLHEFTFLLHKRNLVVSYHSIFLFKFLRSLRGWKKYMAKPLLRRESIPVNVSYTAIILTQTFQSDEALWCLSVALLSSSLVRVRVSFFIHIDYLLVFQAIKCGTCPALNRRLWSDTYIHFQTGSLNMFTYVIYSPWLCVIIA